MLNPANLLNGNEQHESFTTKIGRNKIKRVQYDYRHTNGKLFTCVAKDLGSCQFKRDMWLDKELESMAN